MVITGNIVFPLETLILRLEGEGFKIGPDTRIRMQTVLKELGIDFFYKPRDLKQIICPLVARNRIEQEKFNRVFDDYFSEVREEAERKSGEINKEKTKSGKKKITKKEDKPPKKISEKWFNLLIFSILFIIITITLIIPSIKSTDEQVLKTKAGGGHVEGNGTPSDLITRPGDSSDILKTFFIIIILLSISYFLKKIPKKEEKLQTGSPYLLPFPDQNRLIQFSPEFNEVANAMRQRREGDIQRLDIPGSISRTIRSGGFPELKFKQTSMPSEYLVLIDKQGLRNQQVKLFEYLVDSLEREDIFIEKFFFQSDPHNCWNKNFPVGLTLQELHNKFPKHRLVIFSDGAYMVDPLEYQLASWANPSFENWKERALLTPVAVADWGYKERLLNSELFVVLPADINGQLAIVESVSKSEKTGFRELRKQFFDKNQISCQIDFEDISDLKRYMDNDALFYWVCALSIYPRATWEVTLAIGEKLSESKRKNLLTYSNLLKLTRIKWMQTGDIPFDIKKKLLNEIQEKYETKALAYQAVDDLLKNAEVPEESFAYKEKKEFWESKEKELIIHPDSVYFYNYIINRSILSA